MVLFAFNYFDDNNWELGLFVVHPEVESPGASSGGGKTRAKAAFPAKVHYQR